MRLGRENRHLEELAQALGLSLSVVMRYAKGASAAGWLQRLWNTLNSSGRSSQRMKPTELPPAVLDALGRLVESPEERRSAPIAPPQRTGGGRNRPPATPGSGAEGDLPPGGFSRSRFNPNFAPPLAGESTPMSEEILCGEQSSNVYSFAYDFNASTLFVTYWGHKLNPESVRQGRVKRGKGRGRTQLIGRPGSTVGNERGGRGAMYAYFDVPVRVFERMKSAASKGKFVWDELRVRGSVYGHKYRFSLVQGQVNTQRGVKGVYIPRKATAQGFRTRSVADLGTGKRGFQTSTLPQQNGFSTRRRG